MSDRLGKTGANMRYTVIVYDREGEELETIVSLTEEQLCDLKKILEYYELKYRVRFGGVFFPV